MLDKYRVKGIRGAFLIFGMSDETFSINCAANISEDIDKGWLESMMEKSLEINAKILESIIVQLELDGIKYEKIVVPGEPYEEILKVAGKFEYDYIVMGRRGFLKITRFFVGSVTHKVISESPCPVIVVKE